MTTKQPKKNRPWIRLEQWIEVEIENGRTVTTYYPPNPELLKSAAKMNPPPEVVYRRFNFPDGVPPEYCWTNPTSNHIAHGGAGIQRLRFSDWRAMIVVERGGHATTSGRGIERRWGADPDEPADG